jgi:hypothetical protein
MSLLLNPFPLGFGSRSYAANHSPFSTSREKSAPTPEATRLIDPYRTSPAAKI